MAKNSEEPGCQSHKQFLVGQAEEASGAGAAAVEPVIDVEGS
jgi:hypothetical protein